MMNGKPSSTSQYSSFYLTFFLLFSPYLWRVCMCSTLREKFIGIGNGLWHFYDNQISQLLKEEHFLFASCINFHVNAMVCVWLCEYCWSTKIDMDTLLMLGQNVAGAAGRSSSIGFLRLAMRIFIFRLARPWRLGQKGERNVWMEYISDPLATIWTETKSHQQHMASAIWNTYYDALIDYGNDSIFDFHCYFFPDTIWMK